MTRSGTVPDPRGQTQKPLPAQNRATGTVPDQVKPDTFKAYGLRKVEGGYELCEVTVDGPMAHVRVMSQPEPQRAIAGAYLEAAVERSYWEETR